MLIKKVVAQVIMLINLVIMVMIYSEIIDEWCQPGKKFHGMVTDAFHETTTAFPNNVHGKKPNVEEKWFYDILEAEKKLSYDECRELQSKLSLKSRMMTFKNDHNLIEIFMNLWTELIKGYLTEDNIFAESYYKIQRLVAGLGLPS